MKGFIAFGILVAVILLGLGLWTATPQGGGGLGEEGDAGVDAPREGEGVVQDDSDGVVRIQDGRFEPASVQVPPNSVVTFLNRDDAPRGIDFEDDQFEDAEEIAPGGAHTIEAPASGRFDYELTDDPEVTGTIVVEQE
jgi:plastocyanin